MMKLTCILIAFAVVGTYAEAPEKIVNGIPTSIQEYPHCISMRMNGNHMCGGSLISNQYVLTAAHCIEPIKQNFRNVRIHTGTSYLSRGGESYGIASVKNHESYNPYSSARAHYDIGLIKLDRPITPNQNQRPIALPRSKLNQGEGCTVVAWGSRGYRQSIHDDLQKLPAAVMGPTLCRQRHQATGMGIHETEFCTLITQGTGTCNGDSGSGVVRNSDKTLAGLVSGGIPCARGYPDVFTDVTSFVPWIQRNMV